MTYTNISAKCLHYSEFCKEICIFSARRMGTRAYRDAIENDKTPPSSEYSSFPIAQPPNVFHFDSHGKTAPSSQFSLCLPTLHIEDLVSLMTIRHFHRNTNCHWLNVLIIFFDVGMFNNGVFNKPLAQRVDTPFPVQS